MNTLPVLGELPFCKVEVGELALPASFVAGEQACDPRATSQGQLAGEDRVEGRRYRVGRTLGREMEETSAGVWGQLERRCWCLRASEGSPRGTARDRGAGACLMPWEIGSG